MGHQNQEPQNMARWNRVRPIHLPRLKRYFPQLLPGLALGLYVSRVLGEAIGLPGWVAAVLLSLLCVGVAVWGLRQMPWRRTWPALLLLVYVLSPEVNPSLALTVGGMTLLLWLQGSLSVRQRLRVLNGRRWSIIVGLLLAAAFALLYWRTLAPGLLPADSGELQVVAATLGVAHPPGFPLYTLLAHGFVRLLPGVSPAYSVNLFSAVIAALTLFLVFRAAQRVAGNWLAGVGAAFALGSSTTFWAQATTANIRSLTALFTIAVIYLLICYRQALSEAEAARANRYLIAGTAVLSLGLTHHASLVFMAVVFALFVLVVDPALIRNMRRWPPLILAALVGLIPLLYLPLRAGSGVRGATADLATFSGFLDHVLATGFRGDFFYFVQPTILWERLQVMGNVMTFQFDGWLLLGMVVGGLLLIWRDRPLAFLLVGSFLIHTLITATYRAPQTVEYMIPAYVAAVLCLGFVFRNAIFPNRVTVQENRVTGLRQIMIALLLVAAVKQGTDRFASYDYLHHDQTARVFAEALLNDAPPDSVILAHWHWATPLWYLQEVEGQRPDVESRYVFPEGESYPDTWAQRVEEAYASGRPVIATYYDESGRFAGLPVPQPIAEAFLFPTQPTVTLPADFTTLGLRLGETVQVLGWRLETPEVEIGAEGVLTLAWRPIGTAVDDLTLFAHLVGADGVLYGQQDQSVAGVGGVAIGDEALRFTRFHLAARPGAMPGEYGLLIGAYTAEPLLNDAGESRTAIGTLQVKALSFPPVTAFPLYRTMIDDENRHLVGYDWDGTLPYRSRLYLHWQMPEGYVTEVRDESQLAAEGLLLPPYRGVWGVPRQQWELNWGISSLWTIEPTTHYVPFAGGLVWTGEDLPGTLIETGDRLVLDQYWHSTRLLTRDFVVSVRLMGLEPDGFHWAWDDLNDSIPALGAIPTLKWIAGSAVRSPHFVTVDEAAVPGQTITGALTMYDAFTGRPLAILDERITAEYAWVPLGQRALTR